MSARNHGALGLEANCLLKGLERAGMVSVGAAERKPNARIGGIADAAGGTTGGASAMTQELVWALTFANVLGEAKVQRDRQLSGIGAAAASGVAVRAAEEQAQLLVERCLEPGVDAALVQQLDRLAAFAIVAAACARAKLESPERT